MGENRNVPSPNVETPKTGGYARGASPRSVLPTGRRGVRGRNTEVESWRCEVRSGMAEGEPVGETGIAPSNLRKEDANGMTGVCT